MENPFEQAEKSNQQLWDELATVHAESYGSIQTLKTGGVALDEIELREIGDVTGKRLLHLQCHLGTETLSWARKGAIVTGVDFSEKSLEYARQLQQELKLDAMFIHSNIYALREVLRGEFDIVYTSQGVLCWLKDLTEWARLIAHYLKPDGMFYIMESHPICNIFNDVKTGTLDIIHPYFHQEEPTVWDDDKPDYADESYIPSRPSYEWNWAVSDILNALIRAGLTIELFNEYDKLFDKRFPDMVQGKDGWYYLPRYARVLPLTFTLRARKI